MSAAVISAGKLRHRLTIQQKVELSDGSGGSSRSWATFLVTWGSIEPASARELYFAQRVNAVVSHKITIRYYPGIIAAQQILYQGRTFQIRGILNPEERNRFLILMCEEGKGS